MDFQRVVFSGHAVQRMFERALSKDDVVDVIREGEVVEHYAKDTPYPSCLMLGYARTTPIHVVVGIDEPQETVIVITGYVPDPALWSDDFRTRRQR